MKMEMGKKFKIARCSLDEKMEIKFTFQIKIKIE